MSPGEQASRRREICKRLHAIPGKLDHASVAAYVVGIVNVEGETIGDCGRDREVESREVGNSKYKERRGRNEEASEELKEGKDGKQFGGVGRSSEEKRGESTDERKEFVEGRELKNRDLKSGDENGTLSQKNLGSNNESINIESRLRRSETNDCDRDILDYIDGIESENENISSDKRHKEDSGSKEKKVHSSGESERGVDNVNVKPFVNSDPSDVKKNNRDREGSKVKSEVKHSTGLKTNSSKPVTNDRPVKELKDHDRKSSRPSDKSGSNVKDRTSSRNHDRKGIRVKDSRTQRVKDSTSKIS